MLTNLRSAWIILWLILFSTKGYSQNFVGNGDFEKAFACPYASLQFDLIPYSPGYSNFPFVDQWVSPILGPTPDYYRNCTAANANYAVPTNQLGYQQPHSGISYAGLVMYSNISGDSAQGYREVITTRLSSPLIKDSSYYVRFYVSPTFITGWVNLVMNEVGANFSQVFPISRTPYTSQMDLRYDIKNDSSRILSDSSVWYEIAGTFKAKGGETWLTIGSFATSPFPVTIPTCTNQPNTYSYMYVDDVSVLPLYSRSYTIRNCDSSIGSMILSSSLTKGHFQWNTGDTTQYIQILKPGSYVCKAYNDSSFHIDSFKIIPSVYSAIHIMKACDSLSRPIELTASLSTASYAWNTGQKGRSIQAVQPGNYVCLSQNTCASYTDSFQVIADTLITVHSLSVCQQSDSSLLVSSAKSAPFYHWNNGAKTNQILVTGTGDYSCESFDGCNILRDLYHIEFRIPATPIVNDTNICQFTKSPVLLVSGLGLVWSTNVSGNPAINSQPSINTDTPGLTMVYVGSRSGSCQSDFVRMRIFVMTLARSLPPDTLVRCNGVINYYKTIGTATAYDLNYKWNTGETSCCIVPPRDGQYIRASYNECALVDDTFQVNSIACENCIEFPTAFTPNGDGRNEQFGPLVRCLVNDFQLSIYNRWGQRIYVSTDQNAKWDGTQNGVPAPFGTYMYMAIFRKSNTGKQIIMKGDLELIR